MERIFDGTRLRQARTAAGISTEQAAVTARRSAAAIRAYETGSMKPPVEVLARLGALLLHPVDWFLVDPAVAS